MLQGRVHGSHVPTSHGGATGTDLNWSRAMSMPKPLRLATSPAYRSASQRSVILSHRQNTAIPLKRPFQSISFVPFCVHPCCSMCYRYDPRIANSKSTHASVSVGLDKQDRWFLIIFRSDVQDPYRKMCPHQPGQTAGVEPNASPTKCRHQQSAGHCCESLQLLFQFERQAQKLSQTIFKMTRPKKTKLPVAHKIHLKWQVEVMHATLLAPLPWWHLTWARWTCWNKGGIPLNGIWVWVLV